MICFAKCLTYSVVVFTYQVTKLDLFVVKPSSIIFSMIIKLSYGCIDGSWIHVHSVQFAPWDATIAIALVRLTPACRFAKI